MKYCLFFFIMLLLIFPKLAYAETRTSTAPGLYVFETDHDPAKRYRKVEVQAGVVSEPVAGTAFLDFQTLFDTIFLRLDGTNVPSAAYSWTTNFATTGTLSIDNAANFNESNASVDFEVDGNTVENLFQVDASDDDIEINGGLNINLPADDNITIDGRTNPRTVTVGAMRWNHTPDASTPNTRALFLDIEANGVPNTQGLHIDLKGGALAAGETVIGLDIVGDTTDSGGGVIRLLELDKTGVGTAEVHGIHIEPEIEEVIHHASGTFIDPTQGWIEVKIGGGFTPTTTAFGSSDTDVEIFAADDDAIYIGADAVFQAVEVIMNTGASNPGIKPTFEIWTGSWTAITPVDGTAGFRESGIIDMEDSNLSSWVAVEVESGGAKFYLRITRTQANLQVNPTEDLIQTAAVTDYIWDKDGNLNLATLTASGDISTATNNKINLEGSAGDTYFMYDGTSVQLYVNNTLVREWSN